MDQSMPIFEETQMVYYQSNGPNIINTVFQDQFTTLVLLLGLVIGMLMQCMSEKLSRFICTYTNKNITKK